MEGRRVVVTGATGQIGRAVVAGLATRNEVLAVARFTAEGSRADIESLGATAVTVDLTAGDFDAIPQNPDYVVHLAADQRGDMTADDGYRANAEATGRLIAHCRQAKGVLVMSSHSVYRPHLDPWHVYGEVDPLGDTRQPYSPNYGMSKVAQEAVARFAASAFDVPVTLARMNAAYDSGGGLPIHHLRAVRAGLAVATRWDPCPYQPIHHDDIVAQLPALLDAASRSTTIVNWAGDEAVTVQQWCALYSELIGVSVEVNVTPIDATLRGSCADPTRRLALAGPCRVSWRAGLSAAVADSRSVSE